MNFCYGLALTKQPQRCLLSLSFMPHFYLQNLSSFFIIYAFFKTKHMMHLQIVDCEDNFSSDFNIFRKHTRKSL